VPIDVYCPQCGKHYQVQDEMAGVTAKCRDCGAAIRIPPIAAPTSTPGEPAAVPQAPGYGFQAGPVDQAGLRVDVHRRVIGVFNIILGVLDLLWAGLMFIEIFAFLGGLIEEGPGEPPPEFMAAFCFGWFLLSAVLAVIQLMAGIALLRRKPGCRRLGIVSAIASCAGLWACCFYPFCLGCGIYSLVVLLSNDAKRVLDAS